MRLYTSDEKMNVDVGTGSIWYSIYSTAIVAFSESTIEKIPLALSFLKTGDCMAADIKETRDQLLSVRNSLAEIEPNKAVYDLHRPNIAAPWIGNIAPTVTSCANLFTTADGKDLFTEVFALLDYAEKKNISISAG